MKLSFYLRASCAVFLSAVIGLSPVPLSAETQPEKKAEKEEATKTSLWMLESENNRVYLLGSLHFLKEESYPLPEAIDAAYKDSKVLVFEADLEELKDPGLAQEIVLSKGLYAEGTTLKQTLPEDLYNQLWEAVSDAGLPMEQMQRMKPWICSLQLAATELSLAGYKPEYGVDHHFMDLAKKDEKEQVFLETAEYQVNLLADLDGQLQEDMLRQTLAELDQIEMMADVLRAAWREGDAEKLDELMLDQFADYPRLQSRLITRRNQNWIPKIEELMQRDENILIVVGSLHLVGKKGVLEYLKAKGHEPVQL
jgi:uncharacterized protein YbaP (TraB family)